MTKIELISTPIIWEDRTPKKPEVNDSWLVTRIFKILFNVITFLPKWCINTTISLMIVPSQMMKTRIFCLIDSIGIFRNVFAPPYRDFRESCDNRHYESFDIQKVELKTRNNDFIRGTLLRSRLSKANQANVPTVICFCPNSRPMTNWGGNYNDPIDYVDKAYKLGYAVNVLMLDYPGVGESDGVAHASYMQEMAETTYEYVLKGLKVNRDNIHLHGWSLGSFMAAYLANHDRDSKGLIFLDRGGVSIVESASELLELTKTGLKKIAYIGKILAIPPTAAQYLLGAVAEMGGWNVFNTSENLRNTNRKIIACYSEKDEVFNGTASYGHRFKNWTVELIELHPNESEGVYHHGAALKHSHGLTKDNSEITDLIGYNVTHIINKSYNTSLDWKTVESNTFKKIGLSKTPIIWTDRSFKKLEADDSWLITRIFKVLFHIVTFLPKWCINTTISLMIVPSQMMKTRIFRLIDSIGIFRHVFAPPYRDFKEACENRHYESFDIQKVELKTRNNDFIRGTLLQSRLAKANQANVPTVICFCPNSRPMTNWGVNYNDPIDYVDKAYKLGYAVNVLMLDYPGVGESDGVAHASYMQEMAETTYEYVLKGLKVNRDNIHLHGWSLGSFMAAYLANHDRDSKGLIFLDRGGSSIVESASELLELTKTSLKKIAYVGQILALPPTLAQYLLGAVAKMGGWDAFNTSENLLHTNRKIIACYSEDDEVFNGAASYAHKFKDRKLELIKLQPNDPKGVYHHGVALKHSYGMHKKTKATIDDLIGHNVARIIDTSYRKSFFSWRKTAKTSTVFDFSMSNALSMLGSEVLKKGLRFFS